MPDLSARWGHPTFHQEHTIMIPRDTTLLKELVNAWFPDKKPRLSSMSIVKHKDHMMKSTLMAPKWMRELGQRRSSTAISRMVRQPATSCPKDCQTTAPSSQLRLQPSIWHWTITNTWGQPSWCSSLLWLNALFAGNWAWRHREPFYLPYHEPALVIESQGHTCSFLLDTKPLWHWRKWKSGPTSKRDLHPRYRPTGKCSLYKYETTGQLRSWFKPSGM